MCSLAVTIDSSEAPGEVSLSPGIYKVLSDAIYDIDQRLNRQPGDSRDGYVVAVLYKRIFC